MKKLSKTVGRRTYKHGQWFRANIDGKDCIGQISINDNGGVFLCQDFVDGSNADDILGFLFSWTVDTGSNRDLEENDVTNLKLLSRKPASYVKIKRLPQIGSYRVTSEDEETIKVGCTPVSRETYLEVGYFMGWIE